jgi:PAS domain S-box-containing protein
MTSGENKSVHKHNLLSPTASELRCRAEARLSGRHPQTGAAQTEIGRQRLVHELEVHQIELEMQNEELKKAWDESEAGLEKYTDLYDFAPVGYLTLDRDGVICEANLASTRMLGVDRSKLINRRFGLSLQTTDLPVFNAFLTRVFKSGVRESCEIRLGPDAEHPMEARLEAVAAESDQNCRAVLTDITMHKQAEEDRLMLSKLELTRILSEGIAHDFNNLLTVMLLNIELAQSLLPPDEELDHLMGQAKKAALTSQALVQQLTTVAKGSTSIRKPTPLAGLILDSVHPVLSGTRVQCGFSMAEDLWLAEVDAIQIGQVIQNLILNAREAMIQGGVISVQAENVVLQADEIPTLPPGNYVRVNITDRGTGISKVALPKIFDPYFSTKQRGTQKGMGLGLSICQTIVAQHGGAISVTSEVGVGSTFHLHLPASLVLMPQGECNFEKGSDVCLMNADNAQKQRRHA